MKVPFSIQGALFAPALIGLLFVLKLSCPAQGGDMCFADIFLPAVFYPVKAIESLALFSRLIAYEPLFIVMYWILIGFFVGLCVDVYEHKRGKD